MGRFTDKMNKIIGGIVGTLVGAVILLAQPLALAPSAALALGVGLGIGFMLTKMYEPARSKGEAPSTVSAVGNALSAGKKNAASKLEAGENFLSMLSNRQLFVKDPEVHGEIGQLIDAVTILHSYVIAHPAEYQAMGSFLASYGAQTEQILTGYVTIETYGGDVASAKKNVVSALNSLEGAAKGALSKINSEQGTSIEASSEAINRLVSMQGYKPDQIDASVGGRDHQSEALKAANALNSITASLQ